MAVMWVGLCNSRVQVILLSTEGLSRAMNPHVNHLQDNLLLEIETGLKVSVLFFVTVAICPLPSFIDYILQAVSLLPCLA